MDSAGSGLAFQKFLGVVVRAPLSRPAANSIRHALRAESVISVLVEVAGLFAHFVRVGRSRRCGHSVPDGLSSPSELRHGRPRLEWPHDSAEVEPFVARAVVLTDRERGGHHRSQRADRLLGLLIADVVGPRENVCVRIMLTSNGGALRLKEATLGR